MPKIVILLASAGVKTPIGQPFMELPAVDSTNIYAMKLVQSNMAGHGTAFFAHQQLAGKGQHGKSWQTAPGLNIIMSIVIDPSPLILTEQFRLSVAIALGCFDLLEKYIGEEASIKWPNDLYWRDRKAGGILIENLLRGNNWQWSVAGMGINVNQVQFPTTLSNPVSIKQITGKTHDPIALSRALCNCLDNRFNQLMQGHHTEQLAAYNQHLYGKNKQVTLKKGSRVFSATITGVNEQGQLCVTGAAEAGFDFGEVTLVPGIS